MSVVLTILFSMAGLAAGFLLVALASRLPPNRPRRSEPRRSRPVEPCWTEAIVSDGRYHYARSQCVSCLA